MAKDGYTALRIRTDKLTKKRILDIAAKETIALNMKVTESAVAGRLLKIGIAAYEDQQDGRHRGRS